MSGIKPVSPRLLSLFQFYLRWYVPRHFQAVRVAHLENFLRAGDCVPTIVMANHPGWWDPLMGILVARHAWGAEVESFAPMDADSLRQYGFFRKLGLFPVEMKSACAGRAFLRDAEAVFARKAVLWMTPQGSFQDARAQPPEFRAGLGALLHRLVSAAQRDKKPVAARVLPLAIEYTFWDERLPEALLLCGAPMDMAADKNISRDAWTARAEEALAAAQRELARLAMARTPGGFATILGNKSSWKR